MSSFLWWKWPRKENDESTITSYALRFQKVSARSACYHHQVLSFFEFILREFGNKKRCQDVFYRASCGLQLHGYAKLQEFLKLTGYKIRIDCFCFDDAVDCYRTHHPISYVRVLSVSKILSKIVIVLSVIFPSILRRISLVGRRRSQSNAVTEWIMNIRAR